MCTPPANFEGLNPIVQADAAAHTNNGFSNVTDATSLTPGQLKQFGEGLLTNYYNMISDKSLFSEFKGQVLSPAFQIVRSNGERMDNESFIPSTFTNHTFSNLSITAASPDSVVMTFAAALPGAHTNTTTFSSSNSPRLDVFTRNNITNQWQIATVADYNPVLSVCKNASTTSMGPPGLSNEETLKTNELARTLLKKAFALSDKEASQPVIVFSTGMGYENVTENPSVNHDMSNMYALRAGNILVASYEMTNGNALDQETPRLTVFVYEPATGEWKSIAHSVYLPSEQTLVDCANSTAPAVSSGTAAVKTLLIALIVSIALLWV